MKILGWLVVLVMLTSACSGGDDDARDTIDGSASDDSAPDEPTDTGQQEPGSSTEAGGAASGSGEVANVGSSASDRFEALRALQERIAATPGEVDFSRDVDGNTTVITVVFVTGEGTTTTTTTADGERSYVTAIVVDDASGALAGTITETGTATFSAEGREIAAETIYLDGNGEEVGRSTLRTILGGDSPENLWVDENGFGRNADGSINNHATVGFKKPTIRSVNVFTDRGSPTDLLPLGTSFDWGSTTSGQLPNSEYWAIELTGMTTLDRLASPLSTRRAPATCSTEPSSRCGSSCPR